MPHQLVNEPIDVNQILSAVHSLDAGGTVLFLGTTRRMTAGRETRTLDYDCYPQMALVKMGELENEARQRWTLSEVVLVHRTGEVPLGEASVAVAVSSPHRDAAFSAARWLIDTLKEVIPIWKREHWADGTTEWVHPGVSPKQQ